MLHRRHEETVCHESCETFEVEWRWEGPGIWNEFLRAEWVLSVQLVDFYRDEVVFIWAAGFPDSFLADGCQGLGGCVCDASEDL